MKHVMNAVWITCYSNWYKEAALPLILSNDIFWVSPAYITMVGNAITHFYKRENQGIGG